MISSFEGVCNIEEGDRVEIRHGYWEREFLRVGILHNLSSKVTYHSYWPILRANNEIKPTIGNVSKVVVHNAAEDAVTGLVVSFVFTAE